VTPETEVVVWGWGTVKWFFLLVNDADTTFYWANGVSFAISETTYWGRFEFKLWAYNVYWVEVSFFKGVLEIPNMNKSIGMSSDHDWILYTHIVDRHCYVCLSYLVKICIVFPYPKLNKCIPTSAYNYWDSLLLIIKTMNVFNWLLMLTDICNLIRWQVPLLDTSICTCHEYSWLVNLPAYMQYWYLHILTSHWFWFYFILCIMITRSSSVLELINANKSSPIWICNHLLTKVIVSFILGPIRWKFDTGYRFVILV